MSPSFIEHINNMQEPYPSGKTGSLPTQGEIHIQDAPAPYSEDNANVNVIKPYAIEEPEDDGPVDISPRRAISAPPDNSNNWQRDLVDSMEQLHCDSDYSYSQLSLIHKRGKKRKPPSVAAGDFWSVQRRSSGTASSIQYDESPLCPKRLRRWKEQSREQLKTARNTDNSFSRHFPSEASSSTSLSPSSQSTDVSNTDLINESTTLDEMDID